MTDLADHAPGSEQPREHPVTVHRPDPEGPTRIPTDRYTSTEWAAREVADLWPKAWQVACSVDHVAEPGDVYEHRAGWLSILIVRGHDGGLRAFQNSCPHRGNAICSGESRGLDELRCPFHHWAWDTTGQITEIPSRKWFGRIDDGEVGLIPARVDVLGCIVFVNADADAMPLAEWLEGIPDDLAARGVPLDDFRANSLITQTVPANWKVVAEGFSETYHVQGIHPEMLRHLDEVRTEQRLWHRHGVSYQQYAVPSPRLREVTDQETWATWVESMGSRFGVAEDADPPLPELADGETAMDAIADAIKAHNAGKGVDLSHLSSAETTALAQYNLFPNATVLVWAEMINVLAALPGATPDTATLVSLNFELAAPGAPRSEPFTAELPEGTDLGLVLGQDVSVMATVQRGLHQPGRTHLLVSDEECRVINLNRNLDEWVGEH